jgi:replication-associated recombination protein RarA
VTTTTPHQALYRRWRAQTFSQIVGQEAVVETLRNAVRTDRVSHAILFRRATRHRQDVARADRREGRQLHQPAGRRPV